MDEALWSEVLPSVALAIALASCTGLRTWLPLFLAGALARGGFLELAPSFGFLASNRALLLFAVATLLEFVGDKIPAVDHALDLLGTVLRPAAGSLLAASVMGRVTDPLTALALGVAIGTPASLVPHAAKSTARLASTTLTAGLANPILSLVEDAATFALVLLAVLVPLVVVALAIVTAVFVGRRFFFPSPKAVHAT